MTETASRRRGAHGSFIIDNQGTVLGFNHELEQLTGWQAFDVVGHHKSAVGTADPGAGGLGRALYRGEIPMVNGANRLLLELNTADGRCLGVEAVAQRLDGPGDRILVSILRVLSRSAEAEPVLGDERQDGLTGLSGHEAFSRQLAIDVNTGIVSGRPLALILIDIDHLRDVNDAHGRAAGDAVLREIAGVLRVSVEDDRRIFRLGGDDFAILLADAGRGEARQVAAAIRSAVERHRFTLADGEARVTVSLGAASVPTDAESPGDLVERAQEALDEARGMGRNRVWCYLRRPRVPLSVPVFFDGADALLVGYTRDVSPSGIFVQTSAPIEIGMRCALVFALPGNQRKVHVIGRIVRTVPPEISPDVTRARVPGMGVEFERFGRDSDRRAIDQFVHTLESTSLRPETGRLSI